MKEYLDGLRFSQGTKVNFGNHGRKKQHETTLIELHERPFDIGASIGDKPTYAEDLLTYYHMGAKEYLKAKGFEETSGYFKVIDRKLNLNSRGVIENEN